MRKNRKQISMKNMIAKAVVWAAGKALESMPVIGPIFKVLKFVNEMAELRPPRRRRAYAMA